MDLIITCRMGSSRLPGKTLKQVIGHGSMLDILVQRAKMSGEIQKIIIATTENTEDDILASHCKNMGYCVFRGSTNDVLSRLIGACDEFKIKEFVEILGDNPLVDPSVIKDCIKLFIDKSANYVATLTKEYKFADLECCFPVGMRVQVIKAKFLKEYATTATTKYYREHPTSYLYDKPDTPGMFFLKNKYNLNIENIANLNLAVNDLDSFYNFAMIINKCGLNSNWIDILDTCEILKILDKK